MNVSWTCKPFDQLSPSDLYLILQLRNEVFIVEQNCVYQDLDNKDQQSFHLCCWQQNTLVAYARIMPPGLAYENPSIGRVVSSLTVRHNGTGKELMKKAIEKVYELFGNKPITIGAQFYLKNFYASLGFEQISDIYLEDGIDHIKMLRKNTASIQ